MRVHSPLAVVLIAFIATAVWAQAPTAPGGVTGSVYVKVKLISVTPADRPVKLGWTLYAPLHERLARFGLTRGGQLRTMSTSNSERLAWDQLTDDDALRAGQSTGWSDWTGLLVTPQKQLTACLAFWEDGLPTIPEAKLDGGNIVEFEAEVSFASAPNDGAIVKTLHHRAAHYNLALYLRELTGPLTSWGPQICTLYEYAQNRLKLYELLGASPCPPGRFIITTESKRAHHTRVYDPETDRIEDSIQSCLGVNTPLVRVPAVTGLKLDPFDPNFEENLKAKILAAVPAAPTGRFCVVIGDEPSVPSVDSIRESPAGLSAFRQWLQSRGLRPADLGAASWDQVVPIARTQVVDAASARLHVETVWFQQTASALSFRRYSAACHQLWGDGVVTGTDAFFGSFPAQPDYFVESRLGAVDRQMHHFGSGESGGGPRVTGNDLFLADMLRSASRQGTAGTGFLWFPTRIAQGWGTLLSGVTALAHGMQRIHYYGYGPMFSGWEYFSDDRYKVDVFMAATQVSRMASQYERYLLDGAAQTPQAATVLSRSSAIWATTTPEEMWTKFGWSDGRTPAGRLKLLATQMGGAQTWPVERRMMHAAVGWASIPMDVVPEETVEAADLASYRALYVQEPNLSANAQKALADWVRAGGVLYLGPGAATRDGFNKPLNLLETLTGQAGAVTAVDAGPGDPLSKVTRYGEEEIPGLAVLDQATVSPAVSGGEFTIPVLGRKEVLNIPGAEVLATYQDGSAAVVCMTVGSGRVVKSGVALGAAFCRNADPAYNARRPDAVVPPLTSPNTAAAAYYRRVLDRNIGALITYPVRTAGATSRVRTSILGVDSGLYELSDGQGALLLLANYSSQGVSRTDLDVDLLSAYTRISTFSGRPVAVSWTGTTAHLKMPLEGVEAVEFLP